MEVESCRRASHLREELAHDFFAVYGQPLDLDLNILIPMLSNALQGYPKSPPKASSCARWCFNGLPTLCGLVFQRYSLAEEWLTSFQPPAMAVEASSSRILRLLTAIRCKQHKLAKERK